MKKLKSIANNFQLNASATSPFSFYKYCSDDDFNEYVIYSNEKTSLTEEKEFFSKAKAFLINTKDSSFKNTALSIKKMFSSIKRLFYSKEQKSSLNQQSTQREKAMIRDINSSPGNESGGKKSNAIMRSIYNPDTTAPLKNA